MAIKQYLKNVVGAVLEPVAKSLWGLSPNLSMGLSEINRRIFRWDTTGYEAYNNKIFYTGANLVVTKTTEAPLTFNKKKNSANKLSDKFYSKNISNAERNTIKERILEEMPDHELVTLFDDPDIMEDFWHNYIFGDGILWFEAIGELSRNTKPKRVYSIRPDRLTVVQNNGKFDNVDHYLYTTKSGEQIRLEPKDVLHLKRWNPIFNALKGYGVNIPACKDIALNDAGNEAEGAAFVNGGRVTLLSSKQEVTNEGVLKNKMTKEQMSSLKEQIENDMAGARNNRRILATNGEAIATSIGDTLAEMEINKSEDSRWKNIFAIMGIPKELSPATFSSSENSVDAGYKALVTNNIVPTLKKFDKKLTAKIKEWWPEIVAVSDLTEYTELAPDLKLMKEVYGTPAISEDERRKIFGFDELGGKEGKAILVPSGMMLLTDVINSEFDETPNSDVL